MQKNKLRILFVNGSFLNDNGAAVIAINTLKLFQKNGHDVAAYTPPEFYNISDKTIKYYIAPKRKKSLIDYIKFYFNWESAKKFKKVLEEFTPDIVHFHSLWNLWCTYSILKSCIDKNIPMVMTLHDCFLICPAMTLIKGGDKNCNKFLCKGYNKFHCPINKCFSNSRWKSFVLSLMCFVDKLTGYGKQVNKYITPSDALKNLMIKYENDITPDKIITINNFLSNEEFGNTKPNYTNKGYFLYIGRLSHEKGVQYLLEAIKDLPRDIEFHIVGKGPEEDKLKKYAEENHLDNVKFLGHKSREEIKEEYQNCISTILPCNWFEIFGMTNVESFINGKPVIASNIGGIPEIVENDINGLLFEPANVKQLKECILKYWNNPDLVIQHGKNGYEKAKIQYSEERYYNELVNLYNEVLEKRKND